MEEMKFAFAKKIDEIKSEKELKELIRQYPVIVTDDYLKECVEIKKLQIENSKINIR